MKKITMGICDLDISDIESVFKTLKTGFLSSGPELKEFEKKFSDYHGYKYGIMVNSGQSALECALEMAKHRIGKDIISVLVPSTTYAATIWSILRTGNIPVFCDVSNSDYNISVDTLIDGSGDIPIKEVDVIMPVDLCGKECNTDEFHNMFPKALIIRDSCEASGLKTKSYSDIGCFSFYVSHLITSGSGGMVCVNSKEEEEYIRSFIAHGRSYDGDFTKCDDEWSDKFYFNKVGASWRSDNMSASLVLSQFNRIEEIVKKRKSNARSLITMYEQSDILKHYFIFPSIEYWEDCVFQFFPIVIIDMSINREHFLSYLYKKGIDSRVFLSLTNQSPFIDKFGDIEKNFPNSQFLNSYGFIIGCHQGLGEEEMKYIIESLEEYIR